MVILATLVGTDLPEYLWTLGETIFDTVYAYLLRVQ